MTGGEVIPIVQLVFGGKNEWNKGEVVKNNSPIGWVEFQFQ